MIVASGETCLLKQVPNVTGPGFKSRLGPLFFALFALSAYMVHVQGRMGCDISFIAVSVHIICRIER